MKQMKVMTVGFNPTQFKEDHRFLYAHHIPGVPEGFTEKEYYRLCERHLYSSYVVIVNLDKVHYDIDEIVVLHKAFLDNKPIFAIGENINKTFFDHFVTQHFLTLAELHDHLTAHYF